jgi:hypothetical protein
VTRFQEAVADFIQRFPESRLFRAIPSDMESLQEEMRTTLAGATEQLYDLATKVRDQGFPYIILSAYSGRSYTEALLRRGVGCLPQVAHDMTDEDLRIATEAAGVIVVDPSALCSTALVPSVWPAIVQHFSRVVISTVALRDLEDARDSLSMRTTATLGWNPVTDSMAYSEIDQSIADHLAATSELLVQEAMSLAVEDFDARTLPGPAPDRYAAALGNLELARRLDVPLLVDDLGLRRLSRNDGISCLDSYSLARALEASGELAAGVSEKYRQALLRAYVVDLPISDEEFMALGEEENWGIGVAAFSLARPWDERKLERYKAALQITAGTNRDAVPGWLALATHGASIGRPVHSLDKIAAVLCSYCVSVTGFDPTIFQGSLELVRRELHGRGANDPLPATAAYLFTSVEEHTDAATAAQVVTTLSSSLDERDRLTVVETILMNPQQRRASDGGVNSA